MTIYEEVSLVLVCIHDMMSVLFSNLLKCFNEMSMPR